MSKPACLIGTFFAVTGLCAVEPFERFPCVLPWDDASDSPTNLSQWLEKPAGRDGFVSVQNGHLFANGKRLRLFGVNLVFGANFPTHSDSQKIAARMAKFGINCVRFHHLDMQPAPGGIWKNDMRSFDPSQLDKLDYFIAELKKNGIYTDLNLHVSRTYPDRPASEKRGNPPFDAGVDNFSSAMIGLQKEYARALLTHVNPYTKASYVAESALALIEINNENSLLTAWHYGTLDHIAAPYRKELSLLWIKWLAEKFPSPAKREAFFGTGTRPAGAQILPKSGWTFEQHGTAVAYGEPQNGSLTFTVEKAGTEAWHAQFFCPIGGVKRNERYAMSFRARARTGASAEVVVMQAHEPWRVLARRNIEFTTEWSDIRVHLTPENDESNARVGITGLGLELQKVDCKDLSFREAALSGEVPEEAISRAQYDGLSLPLQREWFAFLWTLEERYWSEMRAFLKDELLVRCPLVGTQLGWSPFPIQRQFDVIDSHAYWQHPDFSSTEWNEAIWTVKNIPMSGRSDGGILPDLAIQRIADKPFICTEYSHPAPNEFSAEAFPLLCAFAAQQDWDGVFAFAYSHRRDDWNKGAIPGFFDIDQHPVKMATLPASLALFLRGDVRPMEAATKVTFTNDSAREIARTKGPLIDATHAGVDRRIAMQQRVSVDVGTATSVLQSDHANPPSDAQKPSERSPQTDAFFKIETPNSAALIGFTRGMSFEFGGVRIEPKSEWSCIQMTLNPRNFSLNAPVLKPSKTASTFSFPERGNTPSQKLLITATARAENTDMRWTNAAHESVGKAWGRAPSLAEGVRAKISFPRNSGRFRAWALDERGLRRAEILLRDGALEIGPQHRALWYEVATE
jgi:hypothetical protein